MSGTYLDPRDYPGENLATVLLGLAAHPRDVASTTTPRWGYVVPPYLLLLFRAYLAADEKSPDEEPPVARVADTRPRRGRPPRTAAGSDQR